MFIPALDRFSKSWIVTYKDGTVIGEFYDERSIKLFNPAAVKIETARQYLERVNRPSQLAFKTK